ncbi:hypothetical protein [Paraburkholderia bannensis]|uniref:hypothetical protein n=1 Tax=Paraburkholderia bannensis TaxID=765414 RepID=UPI002AB621FD|nr:hypothetical protein [Paraburkholderia bannensis]
MNFLYPYISLLHGAAWNIHQSLEGIGVLNSSFVERDATGHVVSGYWSPAEAVLPLLGFLVLIALGLSAAIAVAGYIIDRKRGLIIALGVLALPGILNIVGFWPAINSFPDVYNIGEGPWLGSTSSMLTLVALCAGAGWCLVLTCVDLFPLRTRFWLSYDHLWYASGLLAGVIFVGESHIAERARSFQDEVRTSQQANAYLLRQVAVYDQWCNQNNLSGLVSCQWASTAQQTLLNYSTEPAVVYADQGPSASTDIYAPYQRDPTDTEIEKIRLEISAYNHRLCPIIDLGGGVRKLATLSAHCQETPASYLGAYPDPLNGKVDRQSFGIPVALDSEGIVPTLVQNSARLKLLSVQLKQDEQTKAYRWLYYLLFASVTGGKIAGATIKIAKIDERKPHELKRSLYLAAKSLKGVGHLMKFLGTLARALLRMILSVGSRVEQLMKALIRRRSHTSR